MDSKPNRKRFNQLIAESKRIEAEIDALLEPLTQARRNYFRSKSEEDKREMERLTALAVELAENHSALAPRLMDASGLSEEDIARYLEPKKSVENRMLRGQLTADQVEITGYLQEHLPEGIERLSRLLPKGWRSDQETWQLDALVKGDEPLSLVKALRIESENPSGHRLGQMLSVAEDYLNDRPAFDHFAAATLVPQLAQFGRRFFQLLEVGGDVEGRISKLWRDPGENLDSTMFELLVAAGCIDMGRRVEFIAETEEKSPDIRSFDPFPLVIECKRRRALSDYELEEEKFMRALFLELEVEARRKEIVGRFDLVLSIEAANAPRQEIVSRLVSQRLAARPARSLDYPWGTVAFHGLSPRMAMPAPTRAYSANMLRATFDWNSDLPEWDGLVCRIDVGGEPIVDQIRAPIGLVWKNVSRQAIVKRAWAPLKLFGTATGQIPPGEFGIIYLAYVEGAREEIADRRLNNFMMRVQQWEHSAAIRIPISFLVRLYPRSLENGEPDLIESTVRLGSGAYPIPELFEQFPTWALTPPSA